MLEHKHCNRHDPHPGEDQKEFFNELAEEWDKISVHEKEKVEYITSLLDLKGNEKILDVGTGTGVMISFYEEYLTNGSVKGVDFSENMICQCKKKYPLSEHPNVSFEVADIYDITSREEYDIIMCYSCFPHFTDHQRAIDIFASALKKDGIFAIAHSSSRDHINHVHSHSSSNIQNDVLPSLEELSSMMKKAGLSVTFERSDNEYHIIIGLKSNYL